MEFNIETTRSCVKYGSIVSFMNDFPGSNETPTLSYDPSNPHSFSDKRKEDNVKYLESRNFLYSHGVFNEFCYLYPFKDIQKYYFNTLFLILPSCEYDSMLKFKYLIKRLKNEILMEDNPSINSSQIEDFFNKFKQEIQANHKESIKLMNNKINFGDCVQFLHIRSGKFLSFKKHDEYLKTYIELTEKMSKNTIFRFTPAFQYQERNSTNVYFQLTLRIACGEKRTKNEKYEKYVSNIKVHEEEKIPNNENKAIKFGKQLIHSLNRSTRPSLAIERVKSIKISLKNIFPDGNSKSNLKENLLTYSANSNLAYKNFGKKILPEDNYIGVDRNKEDYWKLIKFSKDYIKDNDYVNSLDYFCIQNIEKNIFINSVHTNKGESDNNDVNNLFMRRKNEEMKNKNMNNGIISNDNISQKLIDEKDKIPKLVSGNIDLIVEENINDMNMKDKNNDKTGNIKLDYFCDEGFYSNKSSDLKIDYYKEKDYLEPLGLFKIEIVNNKSETNLKKANNLVSSDTYIRIINVFSNKVMSVSTLKNNKSNSYKLTLIDNIDKNNEDYDRTLFKIEPIEELREALKGQDENNEEKDDEEKDEDEKEENNELIPESNKDNKDEDQDEDDIDFNNLVYKADFVKIKSKKVNEYIGIRLNNNEVNNVELVLTNSLSDLTKFRLNFLDEEDKYELHFFEQLLWSLEHVLNYFKQEKENVISENNEANYENIQHILITLENKIKIFKNNRNVKIFQENKFDFLKIIKHFSIVSKLIDLFIANWFHDCQNIDYDKFESILVKYFKEKKEELKSKQIISRKILKILTIIYDLEKSYLKPISDRLLYFFMFVGRDDKCTKFLVHILKNNRELLINLCPTYMGLKQNNKERRKNRSFDDEDNNSFDSENKTSPTPEAYKNMKKCLKRIIRDYNCLDIVKLTIYFSSVFLFFKLMNCLLIYNDEPFMQFYDYYFDELNILKNDGDNYHKPDFEKNPILIDFYLKDGMIYARKAKFFKSEGDIIEENYTENEEDESETNKITSTNKIQTVSSRNINNVGHVEFKLIDLIGINNTINIDKYYKQILYAKLVSLNIFFYSNLSLCDKKFKDYLKTLFNINDVLSCYLTLNKADSQYQKEKLNNNLNNDLKCSLMQLLNYLYFRVPFPFWEKINLFKYFEQSQFQRTFTQITNFDPDGNNLIQEKDLDNIITYVNEIITKNINTNILKNDPFLLLQIFECTKYTLRYLYELKNNPEWTDLAIDLMSKILKLLDKYIGISKSEKANGNLAESLQKVLKIQLDLKDPLFLVTDKFQFLFEKLRKKLESIIRNKEVKSLKKLFKELFGTAVAKENKSYISDTISRNLKNKSLNKLKNYNLSHILLEISINSNKEHKTIINEIMFMMTEIFLEFLQYTESLAIEEVGMKLFELKKIYKGNTQDFERLVIEEIIKRDNIKNFSPDMIIHRYYEYKEQVENKYIEKLKHTWKNGDISCFFLKFLKIIDNVELKNLTLKIIYRLNNQQKIYYENISNYVVFYNENDFGKFIEIKNLFLNMFNIIRNINLIQRLDRSTYKLYQKLNRLFKVLIKNLYNEKKWRHENRVLINYEEIEFYDETNDLNNIGEDSESSESDSDSDSDSDSGSGSDSNSKSNSKSRSKSKSKSKKSNSERKIDTDKEIEYPIVNLKGNEEIIDTTVKRKKTLNRKSKDNPSKDKDNKKIKKPYYLDDKEDENNNINLLIIQQTLYNLGFISLVNEFLEYIEYEVVNKEELKELEDDSKCIEDILISIYKLLVLFIYNNNKHQTLIKDKLYLYICPLRLKKKSQLMLCYIGYFILNLVYNFENKNDLNQIRNLDNVINNLYRLHELDWFGCQEIIPIYVESLSIIIENAPTQYFSSLFQVLQDIIEVLKNKIENKTDTKNDLIALKKILQLIIKEQDKKTLEENKNTAIFPLEKIIYVFLNMINLLKPKKILDMNYLKLSKIFVLTTNLLYNNFNLYKNDFEGNKRHYRNLKKILKDFCNELQIMDRLIYVKNKKNDLELKDFNEFIGLSIPKLCIILQIAGEKNNMDKDSDIENILNTINKFYDLILNKTRIHKKSNMGKEPQIIFLSLKNNKEEVEEIIKNIGNTSLNFMEEVFEELKNVPKLSLIDSKPTITLKKSDQFAKYDGRNLKFNEMWNKIQLEINYRKGQDKYQKIFKEEINKERKKFVSIFFENSKNNNINDEDLISYYNTYCESYKNFYGKDFMNYKNELYFFIWSKIFLMEHDKDRIEESLNNKIEHIYKEFFKNLDIIDFTIEQFRDINVFSNNYEHLLFIKFLNSYLSKLDDKTKSECLMKFIDKPEAENIFALIKYILDELQKKINFDIKNFEKKSDKMEPGDNSDQIKDKDYHYSSHLFENELDEYDLVLQFIMNLSENNEIIKGKMKDYLRIQYNNSKNNNFIVILGGIIESFILDENPNSNSKFLIHEYFDKIIKIIECLTKCCTGSSKENQDCVVKETQMLKFTKFIFEKLVYRPKKYYDTGISYSFGRPAKVKTKEKMSSRNNSYIDINRNVYECNTIELYRKRTAYLKYKLLIFLNVLTVNREKDDKIYELIHQVIDFNSLIILLVETYKEILIEKNCQDNPDSLILDEDMQSRMDNPEYKDLVNWEKNNINDDHFIIFEIGTFSFILINIYLEHLTRPVDNDIYDKIIEIRKQLKKNKCEEVKKSIFDIFVNFKEYFKCIGRCFIIGNCSKRVLQDEDFKLYNGFIRSYSFFFDYTPDIEINFNNKIIKYYVKLSPICKCLTDEMKEEFHSNLDRSSTRSKLESLFDNIESFQYQLNNTKKRLDIFQKWPILDLFLNQYKFYRDLFLIITAFLNILLFASFYRTTDDNSSEPILEYSEDFEYDYGFLYKKDNIKITNNIFLYMSLIQMIISFLILIDYIIIRIPNFTYYKKCVFKYDGNDDNNDNYDNKEQDDNSNGKANFKHISSIVINIFKDIKLLYHAIIFIFCIIAFASRNYRVLVILLMDVIERSNTLMYIVKSILLPIKQIVFTLFLFYLVAYYFSILIYLFIPDQLPTMDCLKFSDCFFTMCDQTIKNSNGIINYLVEEGLYTTNTLWSNARFWIDNWFAIIDTMLVLQIVAAIIIDTFISQREESKKIEKDKKNKCFICGLKKNELNKYYHQVNEHIKLDHYLWNYMFVIFNIMKKDSKNMITIDQIIFESYKKKTYSTWIPYKKCKIKDDEDEKEENSKKENEDKDKD